MLRQKTLFAEQKYMATRLTENIYQQTYCDQRDYYRNIESGLAKQVLFYRLLRMNLKEGDLLLLDMSKRKVRLLLDHFTAATPKAFGDTSHDTLQAVNKSV